MKTVKDTALVLLLVIDNHCLFYYLYQITFKVIWKVDEATLMDFELFLEKAFHSHKKYIHLKVTKQSLLTFVCTILDWLVEELSDYVKKNKDFIRSQGVVAVTIDNAVIFNVVCNKLL